MTITPMLRKLLGFLLSETTTWPVTFADVSDHLWGDQCKVSKRIQKEIDSGMTRRSSSELDYTTFGELNVLIGENWAIFGGSLSSRSAVNKVMASLNSLRGPVAHCSPLAEDEVLRLQLAVRDWFRLME